MTWRETWLIVMDFLLLEERKLIFRFEIVDNGKSPTETSCVRHLDVQRNSIKAECVVVADQPDPEMVHM